MKKTKAATTARRKAPPLTIDPVSAYAVRCLVGRGEPAADWAGEYRQALKAYRALLGAPEPIVVGRAVRLACERHFRDLSRQRTAAFPYYFDVAAAQHIIDFFPTFLTLEDGNPFHLPPWLQFSYGTIYGWKCWRGQREGLRRIVHGFFETSKGSGKTPSAGGIGIYGASFDDEPFAQIYSTGFDEGQASIILNDAIRMAEASPDLVEMLDIGKYNISHPESGSYFRAMSSQHQSKSGPRPHYVLSDEIHEHRDGTVVSKAESGFKNRKQPLGLKYTNSGADRTSYCWELHQKSLSVLEGALVDEQWFAYVCHLDPCAKCFNEGFRQPKDGCPDCDDWKDPAVWPKIAPALGIVIQPKYLQDAIDAALSVPSDFALKRRLNFCIWTTTRKQWISPERWDACKVASVSDGNPEYRPCTAGLDLSSKLDMTALTIAMRFDDAPTEDPAEEVTIEGMGEDGQRSEIKLTLDFSVELIPYTWLPRETLNERVAKERIPFDVWERSSRESGPGFEVGKFFVTDGPVIDHQALYDFIVKDAWKRFRIQRLGYDPHDATMLAVKLRDEARLGDAVVALGQGKKLSEAFKLIELLIRSRRLRHDGNPVLGWCFANAEPQRDRIGALWIEKPSETLRIDLAVGAAMAIHQLMLLPSKRRRAAKAKIWTPDGFKEIGRDEPTT